MGDSDGSYSETVCTRCHGQGKYYELSGTSAIEIICPTCGGTGHISTKMDMFQECRHYVGSTGNVVNGYPRTTEPQKTWLDECAFEAMKALSAEYIQINMAPQMLAFRSYELASSMLAEKMKMEEKD
jgi:RecJ-like exonuclease